MEGEFPEGEVVCEEPILVVSFKIGLCRVDPAGKDCRTVFQRLSFNGRTSTVRCLPLTGRTHQIRVHLQYLGFPILNDPIYGSAAWGPHRGKGGQVGKSDEELLRALVEEHDAQEKLHTPAAADAGRTDGSCQQVGAETTSQSTSCPPPHPPNGTPTRDHLCTECKLVRADPGEKELVMYLHALRYKGPDFEYRTRLPDWAREDWEEGEGD